VKMPLRKQTLSVSRPYLLQVLFYVLMTLGESLLIKLIEDRESTPQAESSTQSVWCAVSERLSAGTWLPWYLDSLMQRSLSKEVVWLQSLLGCFGLLDLIGGS
jgi:hypothetical protein